MWHQYWLNMSLCSRHIAEKSFLPNCINCLIQFQMLLLSSWYKVSLSSCVPCQKTKIRWYTITLIDSVLSSGEGFIHTHIDITRFIPTCNAFSYLLMCMDCFSSWFKSLLMPDIMTCTIIKAFISSWISSFGILAITITDGGHQFEYDLFL